ncbi:MAG: transcription termination factor NusA [Pseudomonadota bacterium]|nr:transcription termination factor NusA [Pseudomonadota bacterium]MEC7734957.1 transcription termination factor NusA [Pseudomonadota bacterium]MEC9392426.1 transcription termination factor NusA [Pseudomonadota bacterium]MEC9458447.1 transcription termination factor NusA [Pseudomonadota bacterium]MED5436700.1 transcription termination factor NusA [Pseudomonadota bacterium]
MSTKGISANRLELLQIAEAVAKEKSIEKEIVISAMAEAIEKAAASKYGAENKIRVDIDESNGSIRLLRLLDVVENVEDTFRQIELKDAKKIDPEASIDGPAVEEELPPIDFGRVAAQSAKQVIVQKVRDAERERHFEEFKDRTGEIISGVVKRVEYNSVVVDLGRAEAIIKRDQLLPREAYRPGDRVRAYIYEVRREIRGPQIFLSRTHSDFMANLFAQEVPEIYDGIIDIIGVARDPGSRAKIAVISKDNSIDPVGACVGMRGSRVQAVVNELQGEKIDILSWTDNIADFVVKALQPAEVMKVVLYDEDERLEVVVPEDQLSLAIGRRGQNVRLASELSGWEIDILTEDQESERRQREFQERTDLFIKALDVDELLAQLLVTEGFSEVEEVAMVEIGEITNISGFDDDTAQEIQARANDYLEKENLILEEKRKELGVKDDILDIEELNMKMIIKLGENDVKSLEDFAYCATDDLIGWNEYIDGEKNHEEGILEAFDLGEDYANELIMKARKMIGIVVEEELEEDVLDDSEEEKEESNNNLESNDTKEEDI